MKTTSIYSYGVALIASLAMMCACSSDDDDEEKEEQKTVSYTKETVAQAPEWSVDMSASDPAPDWQSPDASLYENWAVLMVTLEPELAKYASENDLMAVFINDDLRALSYPSRTISQDIYDDDGNISFILKIFGNELSGRRVVFTLKYYSTRLHHMFTLKGEEQFVAEEEYGISEPFVPPFTMGSTKYPVFTNLRMTIGVSETSDINQSPDDLIAVFVDGECRGTYSLNNNTGDGSTVAVPVFSRQEGETATIRYYSASSSSVLTFKEPIKLKGGEQSVKLDL